MPKNRKPDPLSMQVAIRARLPRGVTISRNALNEAFQNWVETGDLHPALVMNGIFWRNSERHGEMAYWRYSAGANLEALERDGFLKRNRAGQLTLKGIPLDPDSPRGDFEAARETLQGALRQFSPF